MAGPWEQYAAPTQAKPWEQYQPQAAKRPLGATVARDIEIAGRGALPGMVGALAGGTLGLMGGLAAPLTVPLGAMLGGLAVPLADVATQGFNTVTGKNVNLPSAIVEELLNKAGYPQPENTTERMIQAAGAGVGNVASGVPSAMAVSGTRLATPAMRRVADQLAARPMAQAPAAAVGGAAAQGANEAVTDATGEPTLGALAGVGAGMMAPPMAVPAGATLGRRVATPFPSRLNPNEQALVGVADRAGIPLTTGQRTGSPTMNLIESVLSKLPFSSDMAANAADRTRGAFNRHVLGQAGIGADRATPDVLAPARQQWGQDFRAVMANVPPATPDPQFGHEVQSVMAQYGGGKLNADVAPVLNAYADEIMGVVRSGNAIPPDVYQRWRSDIGARAAGSSDQQLSHALFGLQDALDNLFERNVPPQTRQELTELRRQYAAQMVVDRAMQGGTQADRSAGNIPFGSFRSAVLGSDRAGYARGRGQYNEASRLADFLANKVPDSGTAGRSFAQNAISGGPAAMLGTSAGLGAGALAGIKTLGASLAAPPALQAAITSPLGRAYLGNQWATTRAPVQSSAVGALRGTASSPSDLRRQQLVAALSR